MRERGPCGFAGTHDTDAGGSQSPRSGRLCDERVSVILLSEPIGIQTRNEGILRASLERNSFLTADFKKLLSLKKGIPNSPSEQAEVKLNG